MEFNEVSHTATTHRRTLRSTQSSSSLGSSSSSSSSQHTTDADSTTTTTNTTMLSTISDTGSLSTSSTTSDSTTSTPSLSAGSSQKVTSTTSGFTPLSAFPTYNSSILEDVFGNLSTSDPEPYPEGEPYLEPGQGGQGGGGGGGKKGEEEEEEEPVSEPGPDWVNAKMVWQGAWEVHLYTFACLFAGLGLYTLICVIRLWRIHRLLSRRYFVSLNLLMLVLAVSRAVYLSVDGYNSNGTFHPSVDYFFYSISFPCLTSAFSIQLYALLQATKMQFLPPTIEKLSLLITMTVFHFAISVVTDIIVGMYAGMEIMLFVCQLFFILWGLFLFFGYAYIFRRLYLHAVKRQKNFVVHHHSTKQQQQQQSNGTSGGGGPVTKPKSKFTLSVAVKVTFSTAMLGLLTVGLEIYGMVGVYKNFSEERPQPWPWYGYHTALRLVEFLMCATMSYVASQPFRYRKGRQTCCCHVLCAPCAEIFCCGADVNRSDGQAAWSEMDQQQSRASVDRGQVQQVTYDQEQQFSSNGLAPRDGSGKKGPRGGRGGNTDLTVTAKARIYFSDQDDVRPIVTSQPGSRPTSETSETLESRTVSTGGSLSGEGSVGVVTPLKKPAPSTLPVPTSSSSSSSSSSTAVKTWNGVVNTAYMPTTEDPPQPQSPGFKSRKSSIASSEYYLAPSLSLADSMASELDKAFRSMHDPDPSQVSLSSVSGQSQDVLDRSPRGGQAKPFPDTPLPRFLHLPPEEASNVNHLRRSHSAFGRSHFYDSNNPREKEEQEAGGGGGGGLLVPGGPWHQKLFRSRSDSLGGIRTKDVDKATYMSLLDIEQHNLQQDASSTLPLDADGMDTVGTPSSGGYKADPTPPATGSCSDPGTTETTGGRDTPERSRGDTCGPAVSGSNSVGLSGNNEHPSCPSPSSMSHDVNGVMTSTQGPYRTVISVGGVSSSKRGESGGDHDPDTASPALSTPPSYSPSPFSPPSFSGSPSLFRSGLTSSPRGLMGYGSPLDDEDDDIEV
ncbi:hypothetical protein ACOMHN_060675 [Nucella lapillus]